MQSEQCSSAGMRSCVAHTGNNKEVSSGGAQLGGEIL